MKERLLSFSKINIFKPNLRPDRDSHVTIHKNSKYSLPPENYKRWNLGDSDHSKSELSKLLTNYDINSASHYKQEFGLRAVNSYYNQVGFGVKLGLSATDKIALNILYSCPTLNRTIFREFLTEETERNYIELSQLQIRPNNKSEK